MAKSLPVHLESERALLGAILLNKDAMDVAMEIIGDSAEPFFDHQNRLVYTAMVNIYRDGDPMDIVSISAALLPKFETKISFSYIAELVDAVATSANAAFYAEQIMDRHTRRALISAAKAAENALYDTSEPLVGIRAKLESEVFKGASAGPKSSPEHISGSVRSENQRLKEVVKTKMATGVKTGYYNLDRILLPMRPADYIILAATTSTGKTTLACNIMLNVARKGVGVQIFSMEMSKPAIANKLLSIESGVDLTFVERSSQFREGDVEKINEATDRLAGLPIFIDDECGMTPSRLRSKARSVVAKNSIGLIVVDYLGRMHVKGMQHDPVNAVSVISGEIKDMAKELNVPVLCLCQLSRKGAEGKPQLSHLRQSGSLEQDCDIAILLSRCVNPKYVNVEIAKQRTGPIGECRLYFERNSQNFLDCDDNGAPIYPGQEHWYRDEEPTAQHQENLF